MFRDLLLWWAVRVDPGVMWIAALQYGITMLAVCAVAWTDREGETE